MTTVMVAPMSGLLYKVIPAIAFSAAAALYERHAGNGEISCDMWQVSQETASQCRTRRSPGEVRVFCQLMKSWSKLLNHRCNSF
jgi:hypothetical protein